MKMDVSRFQVKLAETQEELKAAQRLRYAVFVEEMGADAASADHEARLEKDRFDPIFDHLLLIDTSPDILDPLDRVAGVYRLMTDTVARDNGGFYGGSEYDLSPLLSSDRRLVELGRSCVGKAYRGGLGMHLLWNGLADYVLSRDIEILFGVASFHGVDPAPIAPALSHLYHAHLAPEDLRVTAQPDSRTDMNLLPPDQIDSRAAMRQIPSLIKAYLRLGGFVGDGAYIDRDFNTIDVCLIMDTARMVSKYRDFYTRNVA